MGAMKANCGVRAAVAYNTFWSASSTLMRWMISSGNTRSRIPSVRRASEKLDDWREISGKKEPQKT
jgi:hypothetical protein